MTRRTKQQILAAIEEAENRIWCDRERIVSKGGLLTDRIRELYSGVTETEELGSTGEICNMSNFEWGYLSGKLAALRWVLDGEWDRLDAFPSSQITKNSSWSLEEESCQHL